MLAAATSEGELEAVRMRYLSRKNADFSRMSTDGKKHFGQQFNQAQRGEWPEKLFKADMDRFLEREQDRTLFGLPPRSAK